ncbi:MAG: carbohydrate kinase [Bacteroidales bacterium]|nr:carbohydrate kinase [Bacteroidales bacterium]
MGKKIYTIGETVLDVIFNNNEPETAKPGGSALNTSVSLGRVGLPVSFISEWGNDKVGNLIHLFLKANHVNTNYVYRFSEGQSALALAFLDKNRDASYNFYKKFPEKRLQIEPPEINENDIILYSSFYAITKEIRPKLIEILQTAKKANAILIYDPNFRKAHADELPNLKDYILENISFADIVRGSNEDFNNIFETTTPEAAYQEVKKAGCKALIYTANKNEVTIMAENYDKQYSVPVIKPVSTIGAGDNFNAGIIYGLFKNNISKLQLNSNSDIYWDEIINYGIQFAGDVCLSYENYISEIFAKKYRLRTK